MKRHGFLICCLGLIAVAAGWMWWASHRGWTASKVERLIRAEIPANYDRGSVERWFERHGIDHLYTTELDSAGRGHDTMARLAGLDERKLGGMAQGVIGPPDANVDLIFPGEICIYFFFDKRGHGVGWYVDPFVFMP